MKYLHLIWSGLARKKIRTVLTGLSVFVAFLLFGYMCAIAQALGAGVEVAGLDRIVVRHKVSIIQSLPASYEARIERIPGVHSACHSSWFGGIYQDERNFFPQMPVVPEDFLAMYPEFLLDAAGRTAWLATRTGAIVGRQTATKYGFKVGDQIPLQATIWQPKDGGSTWKFDLVGIYDGAEKGTDTTQLFFRYDYFDEARAGGQGQVGWYTVRVDDPDRTAAIAAAIDAEFANSPVETKAEAEKAFVQGFANQIGNISAILTAVSTAVFFTILLVAANTMGQSVRERTQELGVLKAIGFTHGQVLGLVLAEALLLTAVAGLAGLAAAWAMTAAGDPTGFMPIFYMAGKHVAIGVLLALGLGLLAGLFPALQAMRLQTADALRRN